MNSLETEYSFLAPTWKLPTVATRSMYSRNYGPPYFSDMTESAPDWSSLNNTMYNSRYIPSTTNHQQTVPSQQQQQQNYQTDNLYGNNTNFEGDHNLTTSRRPNKQHNYGQTKPQMANRGLTYSTNAQNNPHLPAQKRRVQIIDHNHQSPSTVANSFLSSRNSDNAYLQAHPNHTSDLNKSQQKYKSSVSNQHRNHGNENTFGYTGNNFNIHEFLYGDPTPDTGSYVNSFKQQQRRLEEEKLARKSVMSNYKTFAQNGGFGPGFGNTNYNKYGEKINNEKKKKSYSKTVREINSNKIEGKKRVQNNNGQQKNRIVPVTKSRRAREYADTIEKPHNLKPMVRLRDPTSGNVIIRDAPQQRHRRISS